MDRLLTAQHSLLPLTLQAFSRESFTEHTIQSIADTPAIPADHAPVILRAASLAAIPWLLHGFSSRVGRVSRAYEGPAELNLAFTPHDDPAAVRENRRRLLAAAGPPGASWPLATARQTHSTIVRMVTSPDAPAEEADGLITDTPTLFLGILTADCVPILVADTRLRVVAAIHAGWRGTAQRIVEQAVQTLRERFQSVPKDLVAAIGPAIGPCCYEVGEEVQTAFHDSFPYAPSLFRANYLDLWQANRHQFLDTGLPSSNITIKNLCTACTRTAAGERLFFSHRAEQGRTGRMMSLIGIDPLA